MFRMWNLKKLFFPVLLLILSFNASVLAQSNLEEAIDSTKFGTVFFDLNVDSALLIVNNQVVEAGFVENGDSLQIKIGLISIKLSVLHDFLFEKQFYLEEDSTEILTHNFQFLSLTKELLNNNFAARILFNSNALLITDEGSELILNDQNKGTSFSFLDTKTGENILVSSIIAGKKYTFDSKKTKFRNSDYRFTIVENYVKPDFNKARMLAFFPGSSQAYKNQEIKSTLIRIGIGIAIGSVSTHELIYRKRKRDFEDILPKYQTSVNLNEATKLGNDLEDVHTKMERNVNIRNLSLLTALSLYSYSIIDGFISKPRYGYREVKPIEFYLSSDELNQLSGTLNFNF